jgi:hypothetical protein
MRRKEGAREGKELNAKERQQLRHGADEVVYHIVRSRFGAYLCVGPRLQLQLNMQSELFRPVVEKKYTGWRGDSGSKMATTWRQHFEARGWPDLVQLAVMAAWNILRCLLLVSGRLEPMEE